MKWLKQIVDQSEVSVLPVVMCQGTGHGPTSTKLLVIVCWALDLQHYFFLFLIFA